VRAADVDHPDELRVDLDPVPGVEWPQIRDVAMVASGVLADFGLTGWPKTSGSRGLHVYARIEPRWPFGDVRRAAVAVAREIERRAPDLATSKWWKEERHGVFGARRPGIHPADLGRSAVMRSGFVHHRYRP
jgi:DNA primase